MDVFKMKKKINVVIGDRRRGNVRQSVNQNGKVSWNFVLDLFSDIMKSSDIRFQWKFC